MVVAVVLIVAVVAAMPRREKNVFRILGAGFGCPVCWPQARPCEVGAPPLGRSSGLAGAPCMMQDTRNSYLEAERRSFFFWAFLRVWLGQERAARFWKACDSVIVSLHLCNCRFAFLLQRNRVFYYWKCFSCVSSVAAVGSCSCFASVFHWSHWIAFECFACLWHQFCCGVAVFLSLP